MPKHNVALMHEQAFAHARIIGNQRGMAPSLLTSIHPV